MSLMYIFWLTFSFWIASSPTGSLLLPVTRTGPICGYMTVKTAGLNSVPPPAVYVPNISIGNLGMSSPLSVPHKNIPNKMDFYGSG